MIALKWIVKMLRRITGFLNSWITAKEIATFKSEIKVYRELVKAQARCQANYEVFERQVLRKSF